MNRRRLKTILGELPYTAEIYWELVQRHKPWQAHFNLDFLERVLPEAVQQASLARERSAPGKSVFIFASLHYWIEFSALMGLALAGQGHQVTFSFLPFDNWDKPIARFDLRRQNLYARRILAEAEPLLRVQSLLDVRPLSHALPAALRQKVEAVSVYDTQYTLQVEEVSEEDPLYQLRLARNLQAAQAARAWLMAHRPDVIIVPNGTILEMGIVYQMARYLDIPVVTFEFGDQREHIWLAQDAEIMRHETDALWEAHAEQPLSAAELDQLKALYAAREDARPWQNFTRQWQGTAAEGGESVRQRLNLDDRPVVLLATNVLGDSLTLGRQVFSATMAEWIERTVLFFTEREDVHLVIRVHPGETLTHGTSMMDVVRAVLPTLPENIHLIAPEEKINTYDLLTFTDLGLVYTTTVGLEMAMRGIPVVVAGNTHYRGRGFTIDPSDWEDYFARLSELLDHISDAQLTQEQIERSWRYAHLFFFSFGKPFPWHLLDLKDDFQSRPMSYVLSDEGLRRYGETFAFLTGQPLVW